MEPITLPAHFDGQHIQLDVPFVLQPDTRLIVTVLPSEEALEEREQWLALSSERLAQAYGDAEPDYSGATLKQVNPDYAGS